MKEKKSKIMTNTNKSGDLIHGEQKYLFLLDIDGTLLPAGESKINKSIIDEISRLKKEGHVFAVSTGRSLLRVLDIEGIEVFDYIACLIGGEIYSFAENKIIRYPQPLNEKEVLKLVDLIEKHGYSWGYKDDKNDNTYCDDEKFIARHLAVKTTRADFEHDLTNGKVYQILMNHYLSPEEIKLFSALKFFIMPQDYTDITDINSSKKISVDYFKKLFKDKKIIAMGDSNNDIEMLTESDISIAMGNSSPEIKRLTTYTTKSVTEDGVVFAIKNILNL